MRRLPHAPDPFGKSFDLRAQRVRYELEIAVRTGAGRRLEGVYVQREQIHVDQSMSARQSVELELAAFLAAGPRAALGAHSCIDTFQQRPQWSVAFCARLDIRAQSL